MLKVEILISVDMQAITLVCSQGLAVLQGLHLVTLYDNPGPYPTSALPQVNYLQPFGL